MKKVRLLELEIENFKGIEKYSFNFEGENKEIRGANETKKTTVNDAYNWVLTGRDSNDNTDGKGGFDILPTDEKGNVLPDKEAHVTIEYSIDGEIVRLSRIYSETWSRIRGTDTVRMTGNKSGFKIGDREVKKSEFNAFLAEIVKPNIMPLLSSVSAFTDNENKPGGWKENRALLIEMVGRTRSDAEILRDPQFSVIGDDMRTYKNATDQLIKDLKVSKTKTQKKVDEDEIRISQQNESTPGPLDFVQIQKDIDLIDTKIAQIDALILDKSKLFTGYIEKRDIQNRKIQIVKDAISKIEREITVANLKKENDSINLKNSLLSKIKINENKLIDFASENLVLNEEIEALKIKVEALRVDYGKEAAKTVVFDESDHICSYCKQELPAEMKTDSLNKITANFNTAKVSELNEIKKKGAGINAVILQKEMRIKENNKAVNLIDIDSLKKELSGLPEKITPFKFEDNANWDEKNLELTVLENELSLIVEPKQENIDEYKAELVELRAKRDVLTAQLNVKEQITESNRKASLLTYNRNAMIKELVAIEQKLMCIESFIQLKIGAVEPKINSLFETVKFSLFERNQNGGIEEKCKAMIDGKAFNTNVNTAKRVNGGLEIINKLAEFYGVSMPVFIDNRESTTNLIDSESQIVSLIVDEKYKKIELI